MYAAAVSSYNKTTSSSAASAQPIQAAAAPSQAPVRAAAAATPVARVTTAPAVAARPSSSQPTSASSSSGSTSMHSNGRPYSGGVTPAEAAMMYQAQAVRQGSHQHASKPVPGGLNLSSSEIARCLNLAAISQAELRHSQGLFHSVSVLGGTVVQRAGSIGNHFQVQILDQEAVFGLGSTHRLQVRFLVYHPQRGEWVLPPIWPKESRLVVGGQTIFDTTSNNRLGLVSVGTKEPMPAVDVSNLAAPQTVGKPIPVEFYTSTALPREVRWLVVVSVVRRLSESALLAELLQRSPSESKCRARVLNFFSSSSSKNGGNQAYGGEDDADDDDDYGEFDGGDNNHHHEVGGEELNLGSVSVITKDPTSYGRIKYAARGKACDHLQCFDLVTYLTMNQSARDAKWKCPLCSNPCEFRSLVLDSWFQALLDAHKDQTNVTGFNVRPDGSVEPVVEDEEEDYSDEEEEVQKQQISPGSKRARTSSSQSSPAMPAVHQQQTVPAPLPPKRKTGQSKFDAIELLDDDDVLY